jgi:hypothetical protein
MALFNTRRRATPAPRYTSHGYDCPRTTDGFPSFRLTRPNATIAGRPALETKTSGGWCASLGGTETITVTIPRDQPDNWYGLNACLSAPNLPQQEAQISAMLHTVQIAGGDLVGRRGPSPVMWHLPAES